MPSTQFAPSTERTTRASEAMEVPGPRSVSAPIWEVRASWGGETIERYLFPRVCSYEVEAEPG